MQLKKNKFIIIFLSSILLLILILVSSIPFTDYLKRISINDNQFVKDQVVINHNAKSSKVIDRMMTIKFNAEVASSLQWDFQALTNDIKIKIWRKVFKCRVWYTPRMIYGPQFRLFRSISRL